MKIVEEFNYLVIKLMANGKWKRDIEDMVIKGNRLMVMFLRSSIKELGLNDIKLQKRICQGILVSIVHYGSELWGCEKGMGLKKIQLRYFKRLLGLNDRLNSLVIRGDLVLDTLRNKTLVKMVKFWERIT